MIRAIRLQNWTGMAIRRNPKTKQRATVVREDVQSIIADGVTFKDGTTKDGLQIGVYYTKTKKIALHYRCDDWDRQEIKSLVEKVSGQEISKVAMPPDTTELKKQEESNGNDFDP